MRILPLDSSSFDSFSSESQVSNSNSNFYSFGVALSFVFEIRSLPVTSDLLIRLDGWSMSSRDPHIWFLTWVLGVKLSSSCLPGDGKHFTNYATTPAAL